MIDNIKQIIDNKIIPYTFKTSKQPMLFGDLMEANKLYQNGMNLEGNISGMKFRTGKAYIVFLALWHIIIIPGGLLFHTQLINLDCHLSIIFAIIFTAMLFSSFTIYKELLIEYTSEKIIKEAWENHLPLFNYEKNAYKAATIYSDAVEKGITKKEMFRHITSGLSD